MTGTVLEEAVRRLERAIVRLEQCPLPAPVLPVEDQGDRDALERLQRRHDRLRTRMTEAVRSLDRVIGDVS